MPRLRGCGVPVAALLTLAACAPVPETAPAPATPAPTTAPAPSPSVPGLRDANLDQLASYSIDVGVPVVIGTTLDAGDPQHFLGSHPDGTVDFTGTTVGESTRMTIEPAQVRRRTADNRNTITVVATPAIAGSAPPACVTDTGVRALRLEPCRPGDAAQAWKLVPEGDSGLFSLHGKHTAIEVDGGRLVADGGWAALETRALKP
ncbi:hypothetical protein L083_5012 [Actinoplanes sp. N902-109]|nr:hypothetical protein L083_5012 [Actinoplanes sp. N902-109]